MSNLTINGGTNIFINMNRNLGGIMDRPLPKEVTAPNSALGNFLKGFDSGFASGLMEGMKQGMQSALAAQSCPASPPVQGDSSHPSGGLQVDKNTGTVTTPGGYKIEQKGQYNWSITGPDGHNTEVWGDPHVKQDGKDAFDFKRNSSFVLGDGTKIDVSTKPYNNMTVTGSLSITSGNDRVEVSDIDKGKGKVGDVTHDGFQHINDFGKNDAFVMGKTTADWTFQGKKIVGSENGGESFKLGEAMAPMTQVPNKFGGPEKWSQQLGQALNNLFKQLNLPPSNFTSFPGHNPYAGNPKQYNAGQHMQNLGNAFQHIGDMLKTMNNLFNLTNAVNRHPMFTA